MFYVSVLAETLVLSVNYGFFNIYAAKLVFEGNDIVTINRRGRKRTIRIIKPITVKAVMPAFNALENMYLIVSFFGGVQGDEHQTGMLCGSFLSMMAALEPVFEKYKILSAVNVAKVKNDELTLAASLTARVAPARALAAIVLRV